MPDCVLCVQFGYVVNGNKELCALGVINFLAPCYPSASGIARSATLASVRRISTSIITTTPALTELFHEPLSHAPSTSVASIC